jgi:peptide/nickel transport system ATP-binding protein
VATSGRALAQVLKRERELGVSQLFITHDIGVVEYIADRVAVMCGGLIEEQGDCNVVLSRPGSDYTRTLLAAVPRPVGERG